MNLLTHPVLTVTGGVKMSLPALLAAMARGEARGFSALRPHQRPAWHMFLVQLGALALWTAGRDTVPAEPADWAVILRGLTPDHADDAPWCLVVEEPAKPAFLQPPDPGGLTWSPLATPDALDFTDYLPQPRLEADRCKSGIAGRLGIRSGVSANIRRLRRSGELRHCADERWLIQPSDAGTCSGERRRHFDRSLQVVGEGRAPAAGDSARAWSRGRGWPCTPVVSRLAGRSATRLARSGPLVHRGLPSRAIERRTRHDFRNSSEFQDITH